MQTRIIAAAAVTAVALFLPACSSDKKDSPPSGHTGQAGQTTTLDTNPATATPISDHNDMDVLFSQQMIMHHQQAIDMAKLVDGHTTNQAVIDLAKNIQNAQQPEIDTFTGWLAQWNQPVMPADHHDMDMPGMVGQPTLDRMHTLDGPAFDQLWLTSMIAHHQGAIAMSTSEISGGKYAPAKVLAQQIIDDQQPQIDTMNGLLKQG